MTPEDIRKNIFSLFANVASSIGYSSVHGEIIGALVVEGKPLSSQELAKKTGYSLSMISLSLDLLEVLGVINKVKKSGDRKLYVQLNGNLLECLKKAIIVKVEKSVADSLTGFEEAKKHMSGLPREERESMKKAVDVLEGEIKRLDKYMKLLSKIQLP